METTEDSNNQDINSELEENQNHWKRRQVDREDCLPFR